jgi:hypothetical protein
MRVKQAFKTSEHSFVHIECVLKTIDTSVSKIEEREHERQEVMNKC